MSGQSSTRFSTAIERGSAIVADGFARLSQPANVKRIRIGLVALALVWLVFALAQLFWALYPEPEVSLPADIVILNPAEASTSDRQVESVDIQKVIAWHLLGKAGEANAVPAENIAQTKASSEREGIEEGARETRLDLRLKGIVASSEDGLGHAIIEYKSKQQVYAVEDKLPISGRVILSKVMPDRVVIDNRGTYELLILYEDTSLTSQVVATPAQKVAKKSPAGKIRVIDKRDEARATALATGYRQQLYQNPQSLTELVQIRAVREEGVLRGYSIAPGSDIAQFTQLGFKKGDVVTSVNGIALDDPGNTVRLYQLMRDAEEVVFELERGQELLTVSVSLDDSQTEQ